MAEQSIPPAGEELKDKSMPELMVGLYGDISSLVRAEIELAKAEIGEKASVAGQGAGLISGSIFALIMAVFSGTALAIIGLANLVAPWAAALIVTVFWLLAAGVLAITGKGRFKRI
ncbi:MAG: phage holin family protein [Thermoleophilia bacterium]|nr:phage holin family protein [Thermoleophilia bacterium]